MTLEEFLAHVPGKKRKSGHDWLAICPTHADRTASLSISAVKDKIVVHCFAGCETRDVISKIGLRMSDLFVAPDTPREIAAYPYRDEHGILLYQVMRFEPKDFRVRRPDGRGGWTWNLNGVRRVIEKKTAGKTARRIKLCQTGATTIFMCVG